MNRSSAEFTTHSPEETVLLGKRLGAALEAGDVLGLTGPLGAGKTLLVKGMALGLGVKDAREVTSPTFVLMNIYRGRLRLHHFDAYRLRSPDDLIEIGCDEAFYGGGVSAVEWADRVEGALPADHVAIGIEILGGADRAIRLSGAGERARRLLGALASPIVR